MQIDVGAAIASLLYENDTVSIPGLGAFVKSPRSAEVDQEKGRALPEHSTIEFDQDLPIDDGLLIAHIKETYSLKYSEAKQTVSRYVDEVKSALQRKETVVIPQVGKLYNDIQNETKFIADPTNFNLDTFGLPEVSIHPLGPRTAESVPAEPEIVAESRSKWMGQNWPVLATLFVLLFILLGFLYLYPKYLQNKKEDPTADLPANRLNVKPPVKDGETADLDDASSKSAEESAADYDEGPEDSLRKENRDQGPICVIAVGIFREKANVDRLAQQLLEAGYEPYIEKLRSTTRVGVQFRYENSQEIDRKLQEIREKFVPEAFVFKK